MVERPRSFRLTLFLKLRYSFEHQKSSVYIKKIKFYKFLLQDINIL
jgi:hypothetical protein